MSSNRARMNLQDRREFRSDIDWHKAGQIAASVIVGFSMLFGRPIRNLQEITYQPPVHERVRRIQQSDYLFAAESTVAMLSRALGGLWDAPVSGLLQEVAEPILQALDRSMEAEEAVDAGAPMLVEDEDSVISSCWDRLSAPARVRLICRGLADIYVEDVSAGCLATAQWALHEMARGNPSPDVTAYLPIGDRWQVQTHVSTPLDQDGFLEYMLSELLPNVETAEFLTHSSSASQASVLATEAVLHVRLDDDFVEVDTAQGYRVFVHNVPAGTVTTAAHDVIDAVTDYLQEVITGAMEWLADGKNLGEALAKRTAVQIVLAVLGAIAAGCRAVWLKMASAMDRDDEEHGQDWLVAYTVKLIGSDLESMLKQYEAFEALSLEDLDIPKGRALRLAKAFFFDQQGDGTWEIARTLPIPPSS